MLLGPAHSCTACESGRRYCMVGEICRIQVPQRAMVVSSAQSLGCTLSDWFRSNRTTNWAFTAEVSAWASEFVQARRRKSCMHDSRRMQMHKRSTETAGLRQLGQEIVGFCIGLITSHVRYSSYVEDNNQMHSSCQPICAHNFGEQQRTPRGVQTNTSTTLFSSAESNMLTAQIRQ